MQVVETNATAHAFGVLLGGSAVFLAGVFLFDTWFGDPTIYLSFARNIARGDLFAFNAGEFSSGSTSPLWAFLLAAPYLMGLAAVGAKVLALLVAVMAYVALVALARRFAGRTLNSALALPFAAAAMAVPCAVLYESGLVVAGVCAALIAGDRFVEAPSTRRGLALAGAWVILPLTRPELVLWVPVQAASLALATDRKWVWTIGAASVVSLVPAGAWFGASWIATGTYSVAGHARSVALRESASQLGPIVYSNAVVLHLIGMSAVLLLAALGLDRMLADQSKRWFVVFGCAALALHVVLLAFVSPVTDDVARYLLPVAPILVVAVARALSAWTLGRGAPLSSAFLVLVLCVLPLFELARGVVVQRARGLTLEEVTERDATDYLNEVASTGDAVLTYEVQARYGLRDDLKVYSLDGLTDARMHPYLRSRDLGAYLREHRPRFWIVNQAVASRQHLAGGLLDKAARALATRDHVVLEGISFRVLHRRARPPLPRFAGWQMIVAIE